MVHFQVGQIHMILNLVCIFYLPKHERQLETICSNKTEKQKHNICVFKYIYVFDAKPCPVY